MAAVADSPTHPGALRAWWSAIRPRTLPVSLAPVAVGTGVASAAGAAALGPALLAAGGALALQIGSNLVNDYADHARGADGPDRLGPPRAAQQGWLRPEALRRGASVAFGLSVVLGLALVALGGWPIAVGGAAALFAAWAYTGGPAPLGYRGLGDLLVFVFFGLFAVAGTSLVQVGELSWLALAAGVPVGFLAAAVLGVNNLRDLESDARAGKRTLAVRLGEARARQLLNAQLLAGAISPLALPLLGAPWLAGALPLLVAPFVVRTQRALRFAEGAALNPFLARVVQLELAVAAALTLGLVVA